jgi:hypothetical protein
VIIWGARRKREEIANFELRVYLRISDLGFCSSELPDPQFAIRNPSSSRLRDHLGGKKKK